MSKVATEFKPKIIVFTCNWCAYAGADLAGVSRLQMKPYFRIIRTTCSARVEPSFVLEAFKKGADGVLVAGCHPGDCHYIGGNFRTRRRMALLSILLEQFGLNPKRFKLDWISAGEAQKFQKVINKFIDTVYELGPSPYKGGK
ncbi:hydrogenase iron-sulfur subunit [Candidatus Dependentiae bacterium]|nr:hydrogenase iron-sulfur subunit [Candidatus Dependentiae bacterium]